jgi:hypothetical protein
MPKSNCREKARALVKCEVTDALTTAKRWRVDGKAMQFLRSP